MGGRREPERSCVGCRGKAPKAALVRLVRTPGGRARVDPTARESGRGAYVHGDRHCVDEATRRGALGRALRVSLGPDEIARLRNDIEEVLRP